jgi:hypothetical protein
VQDNFPISLFRSELHSIFKIKRNIIKWNDKEKIENSREEDEKDDDISTFIGLTISTKKDNKPCEQQ